MTNAALVLSLLLTVASQAVYAAQHVVGDGAGWSKATDYAAWAATKTFAVGDTLVFYYSHKDLVYEVSEDDYKNCRIGKPLNINHGGQTIIPLDKPGPRYFLSPTFGHCASGMKLAVSVKARNTIIGHGSANVKDLLTPPVMPLPFPFPPPPALPAGTCPGGGGGGGAPFNPFIFGPPNPFGPTGGAACLGGMRIYMMGFYSLCVLLILVMV